MPYNDQTANILHDMRLVISMPRKEPFVYKVSKVQDTIPKGVITFTLKQTEYNQFTDNSELMIADYYSPSSPSEATEDKELEEDVQVINLDSASSSIGMGYSKNINISVTDANDNKVELATDSFEFVYSIEDKEGNVVEDDIIPKAAEIKLSDDNLDAVLSVTLSKKLSWNNKNLRVLCRYNGIENSIVFDIRS